MKFEAILEIGAGLLQGFSKETKLPLFKGGVAREITGTASGKSSSGENKIPRRASKRFVINSKF